MIQKTLSQTKLEETAQEIRGFIHDAQRKLLEFEVLMSQNEIKEGKIETFTTVDELFKELA